eukprot:8856505-Pyramimonas_sp.AAC.1
MNRRMAPEWRFERPPVNSVVRMDAQEVVPVHHGGVARVERPPVHLVLRMDAQAARAQVPGAHAGSGHEPP